jgi:hypothetical protein
MYAARVAIEAIREATGEMLEHGLMASTNLTTSNPSARMADQWRAMIDAALNAEESR